MYPSAIPRSADAYRRIGVETSMHTIDQHQIVSLLFDGLLQALATARGALARGDVSAKCHAISRALRILEEGLSTGLDREAGGELADNLAALYDYCVRRLILANAQNDDALLQEVQRLIEPVAQSWKAIRPGAAAPLRQAVQAAGV
jgi:flagellar protein FliS